MSGESVQNSSLSEYKVQLSAVVAALETASDSEKQSLIDLKEKILEVILLLEGNNSNEPLTSADLSRDHLDDEFLKFQSEIIALDDRENLLARDETGEDEIDDARLRLQEVLQSMEGKKCRAPFIRHWGEKAYHNAIIFSTDMDEQLIEDLGDVQVKVMFCNPLCDEMKPCPYFLDGHCKFDSDKCRFSHGYIVKYSDLEEYSLPNYSNVQRDSRCLAKFKDGLWHTAVIEKCLDSNQFVVKYDRIGSSETLEAYDILPLENLNLSDSDDDDSGSCSSVEDSLVTQEPNCDQSKEINYAAEIGSSALGAWEQHTKGMGSKLMAKMGYVWGQGLGKHSDGRIEPIEAIMCPKGKSLDKCVELREAFGPVSVEDKFNAEKMKEKERAKNIESNAPEESSVFSFLNKNLSRSCDVPPDSFRKRPSSDKSAGPEKKTQTKDLNFQMFSVGEDIKKTKKEISKLQQSLSRNADKNEVACSRLKQQMVVQTSLLKRLESREKKISDEINVNKGHKKIITF